MSSEKTQALTNKTTLQSYMEITGEVIDKQIQTLKPAIHALKLHRQLEYALQTRGKQLRAAMVLLSGESVGGTRDTLEKLALAVELLHAASLVHDDILDREVFRRNALSVQAKWGVKEAVLVGDALASLGLGLCRGYGGKVLEVMASACLQLSDGEYLDVSHSRLAATESEYFEKAKKKTGALFRAAAACGALASNGSANEVDALAGFGENYGVAFQIKDDLTDIFALEQTASSDLFELRATLPIIHLTNASGANASSLLAKLASPKTQALERKVLLGQLRADLEKHSLAYCVDQVRLHVDEAVGCLGKLKESGFKLCLIELAKRLKLT